MNNTSLPNKNIARVCVFLPTYNGAKYLNFAVKSVLAQTFSDWCMVIADDGSHDQTVQIGKDFSAIDSRIKLISNPENFGLYGSINRGLQKISCDFIVILMQDDLLLPEHLEFLVSLADSKTESQTFWTASQSINAKGAVIQEGLNTNRVEEIAPGIATWYHILKTGCIWIISGSLTRTEYLKKMQFRADLSHAADWEWILRLVRNNHSVYFEKVLVQIRLHNEQESSNNFLLSRDLAQYRTVVSENLRRYSQDLSMSMKIALVSAKRFRVFRRVIRHTLDRRWGSAKIALKLLLS